MFIKYGKVVAEAWISCREDIINLVSTLKLICFKEIGIVWGNSAKSAAILRRLRGISGCRALLCRFVVSLYSGFRIKEAVLERGPSGNVESTMVF